MQVELFREHIETAQAARDGTRKGWIFSCFVDDYNACYRIFKEILMNKKIKEIGNEECVIIRSANGFLVNYLYGGKDFFTRDEVAIFIDLWEQADKIAPLPNTNEYVKTILLSVTHLVKRGEKRLKVGHYSLDIFDMSNRSFEFDRV